MFIFHAAKVNNNMYKIITGMQIISLEFWLFLWKSNRVLPSLSSFTQVLIIHKGFLLCVCPGKQKLNNGGHMFPRNKKFSTLSFKCILHYFFLIVLTKSVIMY